MLTYVAAVATSVTLMISPILSHKDSDAEGKQSAKWTKPAVARTIDIPSSIEISGVAPLYYLSIAEQRVLRKALLRSVKIVSPGHKIG